MKSAFRIPGMKHGQILFFAFRAAPRELGGFFAALRCFVDTYCKFGLPETKSLIIRLYQKECVIDIKKNYSKWMGYRELARNDYVQIKTHLDSLPAQPQISIMMPAFDSPRDLLASAIKSLQAQPYKEWELYLLDNGSSEEGLTAFLKNQQGEGRRLKIFHADPSDLRSDIYNTSAKLIAGDWLAFFDPKDLLHPFAFYWILQAINQRPDAQLIYADEDEVQENNRRRNPHFKSDWNYDLFLSRNYFGRFWLIKRSLFEKVGGFRTGYEAALDYDLILRAVEHISPEQIVHIPKILHHRRVVGESVKSEASRIDIEKKVIADHLARIGVKALVCREEYGYRIKYPLPANPPLVSLIIPTRNGLSLLRQCIDSILEKTLYQNVEFVIVDNGSDDPATLAYLEELKKNSRFLILRDDRPFNYSQLNNLAAQYAKGEIIGLINNDIEVISPDWLDEMVSHALRPGVGAVGAKLLYPDGRVQHAGVILIGGVANHAHMYIDGNDPGYFGRAAMTQEYSAVTAACLIIEKSLFWEAGGLDETNLKVAFNDVDFCLRVGKLGYRNIWTPYALLYHHESASRGQDSSPEKRARFLSEVEYMARVWADELANDPFYNPNLNWCIPDFSVDPVPRLDKWSLGVRQHKNSAEGLM